MMMMMNDHVFKNNTSSYIPRLIHVLSPQEVCSRDGTGAMLANHLCYYRQAHLHRVFLLYTQNLLRTDTFINWSFYTETPYTRSSFTRRHFTTEAVAQSCFYTQKFYTQKPLFTRGFHTPFFPRETFTQMLLRGKVFAQTLLRTDRLVNTRFPQKFSHVPVFTQIFVTYTSLTQSFRYTDYLTHGSFYRQEVLYINVFFAQKFLREENFTQKAITRTRSLNARHATMVRMRYI